MGRRIEKIAVREFLAEFLGTLVLVIIGNGSLAQAVLSLNTKGNFFSVNFGWAIGIFLGLLVSGGVSGGLLNPALTVALAVVGKLPWRKVPHHLLAQYTAATLASALVFLLYWDALVWYEHQHGEFRSIPDTANIFSTFPGVHLSLLGGVGDQVLATALLALSVCSVRELSSLPTVTSITVLGLGVSLGYNCGYPLNPARDLGPRIFMLMGGWGPEVFSAYSHWWIIPLIAPHLGALLGAGLHLLLVGLHWPSDPSEPESCGQSQETPQGESLVKPGRGSNFLNVSSLQPTSLQSNSFQYSNLYHQNEIIETGGEKQSRRSNKPAQSVEEEVRYSVVDKSKKSRRRLCEDSPVAGSVSLSVYEAPGGEQEEEEISLTDLFPDPADFLPPSPTFTFPPLPPTPPDQEETLTESTGRTEIEVLQHTPNTEKVQQVQVFQDSVPRTEKSGGERRKKPQSQLDLPVPTVQITQQASSEREILDSIALTKTKLCKKEERQSRSSSRKNKRRKEKKENTRPPPSERSERKERKERKEREFCEKCHEKKLRRKLEREREREALRVEEPEETFTDRHIEEAEVLRRYIDTEKVYDDTVSVRSYCACSLHMEEVQQSPYKLSQQKMEQVRDAVLVVRNWKHSKTASN